MPVGYSGTPLAKKLGIKEGTRLCPIGAPDDYGTLLGPLPRGVERLPRATKAADIVHLFVIRREDLAAHLEKLRSILNANAAVWVSWPKKASRVPTTVVEDTIRTLALPLGFVDVKVCAVSEVWSGLKLVVRKELRSPAEVDVPKSRTSPGIPSVAAYLAAIADDERRQDCKALTVLMKRATGCVPKMWGTSIVGFDSYHYTYASGRQGDACVVGFSSRKGDISIYLFAGDDGAEAKSLRARLGPHKSGKACLYVRRLSDIELPVLEQLVARSVAETRRRYPAN